MKASGGCDGSAAGSADDNADSTVVLAVLDAVLRRDDCHAAAGGQLPARVAVPLHDARHSLGRLRQQLSQSPHLRSTQQQLPPRIQTGISTLVLIGNRNRITVSSKALIIRAA